MKLKILEKKSQAEGGGDSAEGGGLGVDEVLASLKVELN